jgi:DNA-binding transcriptional regulator YdaS (Cro superfamily)
MMNGAGEHERPARLRDRRARSFTRAAAQFGVSPPALSQTVRKREARLGARLRARTIATPVCQQTCPP